MLGEATSECYALGVASGDTGKVSAVQGVSIVRELSTGQ
jgi:hypothetical protein